MDKGRTALPGSLVLLLLICYSIPEASSSALCETAPAAVDHDALCSNGANVCFKAEKGNDLLPDTDTFVSKYMEECEQELLEHPQESLISSCAINRNKLKNIQACMQGILDDNLRTAEMRLNSTLAVELKNSLNLTEHKVDEALTNFETVMKLKLTSNVEKMESRLQSDIHSELQSLETREQDCVIELESLMNLLFNMKAALENVGTTAETVIAALLEDLQTRIYSETNSKLETAQNRLEMLLDLQLKKEKDVVNDMREALQKKENFLKSDIDAKLEDIENRTQTVTVKWLERTQDKVESQVASEITKFAKKQKDIVKELEIIDPHLRMFENKLENLEIKAKIIEANFSSLFISVERTLEDIAIAAEKKMNNSIVSAEERLQSTLNHNAYQLRNLENRVDSRLKSIENRIENILDVKFKNLSEKMEKFGLDHEKNLNSVKIFMEDALEDIENKIESDGQKCV